ncbi:SIS domain-containing protein, partial [Vibrio alginolyticus]|nr:SIS domain-containing protein [Vibrio alginolyticus]
MQQKYLKWAVSALNTEADSIHEIATQLNDTFIQAVQAVLHCQGRVIVMGMGKSGHVGRKISATLASTGTASFFIHPAEAAHGDLGMIVDGDVVIALSNSG